MGLSSLPKRMVFVCWAAPLGWIVMHSDHSVVPLTWGVILPGQILCALLTFGAAVEYRAMLSSLFPRNGFWLGYLWLIFEFYLDLLNVSLPRNLDNYILLVVVALEAFIWGKRSQRTRWSRASLFFSGNVFLLIAGGSLLSFYDSPFQDAFIRYSSPWFRQTGIFVMLASIVACDTMAYFIGSLFGRHHFTSISPNKTVEGTAAGFFGSVIVSSIGWYYFRSPLYPAFVGPVMGVVIGAFAQVGDLLESLIKRFFKVKDASGIFPGHGGFLDRFDSLFFTAPVVWLYFWFIDRFIL